MCVPQTAFTIPLVELHCLNFTCNFVNQVSDTDSLWFVVKVGFPFTIELIHCLSGNRGQYFPEAYRSSLFKSFLFVSLKFLYMFKSDITSLPDLLSFPENTLIHS